MSKFKWNTYKMTGFTSQAGTDPRACGGTQKHQVRLTLTGWEHRIVDCNQGYKSASRPTIIPDVDGEAAFARAKTL